MYRTRKTGEAKQAYQHKKAKQGSQGVDDSSSCLFRCLYTSLYYDLLVKFLCPLQLLDGPLVTGFTDFNRAM